ncbi:hypothetical protein J2X88_000009 [Pseudomonas extremaustralis]|nr:hypothetical protein [Pseudomonas extremaustralis]
MKRNNYILGRTSTSTSTSTSRVGQNRVSHTMVMLARGAV